MRVLRQVSYFGGFSRDHSVSYTHMLTSIFSCSATDSIRQQYLPHASSSASDAIAKGAGQLRITRRAAPRPTVIACAAAPAVAVEARLALWDSEGHDKVFA